MGARWCTPVVLSLVLTAGLAIGGCDQAGPNNPEPPATSSPAESPAAIPSAAPTDDPTPVRPTTSPSPAPPSPEPSPSLAPPPSPSSSPAPAPTTEAALPAMWRGLDLERIPTEQPVVALTFDGGSSDAAVTTILATLDRYDVPATFFVTGDFARTYPDQVRAMAEAGHPVGNHSDTHRSYPDLTNADIRADLAAAEDAIATSTGQPARPLFRFPYGARTDADIRVVNDAGYLPVRWTVDSLGWKGTSDGLTAAAVSERVLSTAVPGQIVLMHVGANPDDGTTLDADALPAVIEGLRALDYGFTDLSGLLD